jgi:hemolysin III
MGVVDELWRLPRWTQSPGEELANTISHGIGLLAALIATPVLLLAARDAGSDGFFVGTIIFAITMLTLYLGSTLYHAWPQTRGKCVLQVFDHSAIFLLIAGTYTPFALGPLRGPWGWILLAAIWALAIFGVIMKVTRGTSRHPKLALCLYLGMGWLGLVVIRPLSWVVPASTVLALVAGGIAYTAGVIFFVNERRRYNHFIWHLFVIAGTGCHFLALLACTT